MLQRLKHFRSPTPSNSYDVDFLEPLICQAAICPAVAMNRTLTRASLCAFSRRITITARRRFVANPILKTSTPLNSLQCLSDVRAELANRHTRSKAESGSKTEPTSNHEINTLREEAQVRVVTLRGEVDQKLKLLEDTLSTIPEASEYSRSAGKEARAEKSASNRDASTSAVVRTNTSQAGSVEEQPQTNKKTETSEQDTPKPETSRSNSEFIILERFDVVAYVFFVFVIFFVGCGLGQFAGRDKYIERAYEGSITANFQESIDKDYGYLPRADVAEIYLKTVQQMSDAELRASIVRKLKEPKAQTSASRLEKTSGGATAAEPFPLDLTPFCKTTYHSIRRNVRKHIFCIDDDAIAAARASAVMRDRMRRGLSWLW